MKIIVKKINLITIITCLSCVSLAAQDSILPNEGKMITTVMVLAAILIGIFLFLFLLERRLTKIENQIKNES